MTKPLHRLTLTLMLVFALAFTVVARAQEKPAAPPAAKPSATPATPLKLVVVISRYQGEKKVSSLPYTLSVNAPGAPQSNHANLRMGAKIPVMTMAMPVLDGKQMAGGPVQYQDVGTNIDCDATTLEDGRYRLSLSVEDTSIYPDAVADKGVVPGNPSFRSFRATDSMVLKDGGTAQFTTATDKVSGEIVKVDVTLTVVK